MAPPRLRTPVAAARFGVNLMAQAGGEPVVAGPALLRRRARLLRAWPDGLDRVMIGDHVMFRRHRDDGLAAPRR